ACRDRFAPFSAGPIGCQVALVASRNQPRNPRRSFSGAVAATFRGAATTSGGAVTVSRGAAATASRGVAGWRGAAPGGRGRGAATASRGAVAASRGVVATGGCCSLARTAVAAPDCGAADLLRWP